VAVVLDSDVVVGFLDRSDALHLAADAALRELVADQRLFVSAVTYAEVLTGAKMGHHDESHVRGFFSEVVSTVVPVDTGIADSAAGLRASNRFLRMPDALIVATADSDPDVEILLTGDRQIGKLKGLDCEIRVVAAGA